MPWVSSIKILLYLERFWWSIREYFYDSEIWVYVLSVNFSNHKGIAQASLLVIPLWQKTELRVMPVQPVRNLKIMLSSSWADFHYFWSSCQFETVWLHTISLCSFSFHFFTGILGWRPRSWGYYWILPSLPKLGSKLSAK